jgi:hypothetical protein
VPEGSSERVGRESNEGLFNTAWPVKLPSMPAAALDAAFENVKSLLEAKKQLAEAKTDGDKTYYEHRCAELDRQTDRLVYDLYGLTEEEIKTVEGSTK